MAVVGYCVEIVTLASVRLAPTVEGSGVTWIDPRRSIIILDGMVIIAFLPECEAATVECFGILGLTMIPKTKPIATSLKAIKALQEMIIGDLIFQPKIIEQ
jgi:hypothetical protein